MDPMKELLLQAREEITGLRRHNEIMSAKLEMVDLFACVLYTKPATHASVSGIDVAWLLTKEIEKIDAAPPRKPSVEELEEILKSDVERKIVIQPDGSIRAE